MARILLVEDDPALSRGVTALLKAAGHAPDCAKDGETAMRLAHEEPFSLVILDIGLPGISGFAGHLGVRSHQEVARAGMPASTRWAYPTARARSGSIP